MNDYYNGVFDSPYLAHHGVLGMKWGIRRYQNKDGTYTNAGKRRRRQEAVEDDIDESTFSEDYKAAHSGKDPRTMSNAELQRVNNRLNLERNYKQNTTPQQVQKQYTEGQQYVQQTMKGLGKVAIGATATVAVATMSRPLGESFAKHWRENASTGEKWLIASTITAASVGALAYAYHQPKDKNSKRDQNEE